MLSIFEELKFDEKGLVVAIAQDEKTKKVLMQAFMNREALEKTINTGYVHYYSRSRNKLWLKGEESKHYQIVKKIKVDCDKDSILLLVKQKVAACHTGNYSCFFRELDEKISFSDMENKVHDNKDDINKFKILDKLYKIIVDRKKNPKEGSYTNYLFDKGIDKILKKVGEESSEVIIASKNNSSDEIIYEISDLIYHLLVLMVENNLKLNEIYDELIKRDKE
jgi:phosphoribosyl-ATP pyrophosphohydrolase/phosphoribosyl-AMP cyclohydrolase